MASLMLGGNEGQAAMMVEKSPEKSSVPLFVPGAISCSSKYVVYKGLTAIVVNPVLSAVLKWGARFSPLQRLFAVVQYKCRLSKAKCFCNFKFVLNPLRCRQCPPQGAAVK